MIEISEVRSSHNSVFVNIGNETVRVTSLSKLIGSEDAMGTALLLPALAAGEQLKVTGSLSSKFHANSKEIAVIAARWWGFHNLEFPVLADATTPRQKLSQNVGLFFTGGVDSFASLLRNEVQVTRLVNVVGYDIDLDDKARIDKSIRQLRQVAQEFGKELTIAETNLRSHSFFNSVGWRVTHAAALAAIAHLLSQEVGKVLIGSSDVPPPWGSHPTLDPLWSTEAVEIVNDGSELKRLDKVCIVASNEAALRFLKVCFKNRSEDLNCGRCEKCVRTQAQLRAVGVSGTLDAFSSGPIQGLIEGLPYTVPAVFSQWMDIRNRIDSKQIRSSIDSLLRRSRRKAISRKIKAYWRNAVTRAGA
jgi:hypothetical protein